jgi:hypothetical protein
LIGASKNDDPKHVGWLFDYVLSFVAYSEGVDMDEEHSFLLPPFVSAWVKPEPNVRVAPSKAWATVLCQPQGNLSEEESERKRGNGQKSVLDE